MGLAGAVIVVALNDLPLWVVAYGLGREGLGSVKAGYQGYCNTVYITLVSESVLALDSHKWGLLLAHTVTI